MSETRQISGFVIAGVVSTLCNLSSRYGFEYFASYEWALVGSNIIGILTAFVINRYFVFISNHGSVLLQFYRFTIVNIFSVVLSWLIAIALYRRVFPAMNFVWNSDLIAHAVGIAVPVLPNYFAHRAWTFGQSKRL